MKTMNLEEAANFLKLSDEETRRRAKSGKIPGSKLGKKWVFIEEDLLKFIRSQYIESSFIKKLLTDKKGTKKCHYTNAKTQKRGGLTSQQKMVKEYDSLLGLQ